MAQRLIVPMLLAGLVIGLVPGDAAAHHLSRREKRKVVRIVSRISDGEWSKAKIRRRFFGHGKADKKRLQSLPWKRVERAGRVKEIVSKPPEAPRR